MLVMRSEGDAVLGFVAHRRGRVLAARELGGEADDLERVLEIVHDGAGEAPDDGEALGLDDLVEVFLVERPHPVAEFADQVEGQAGPVVEELEQLVAAEENRGGVGLGAGGRGARGVVKRCHLAEEIACADGSQRAGLRRRQARGDLHAARFDHVKAVAGIALGEDHLAAAKRPNLAGARQGL
jgi:hypothetical protein